MRESFKTAGWAGGSRTGVRAAVVSTLLSSACANPVTSTGATQDGTGQPGREDGVARDGGKPKEGGAGSPWSAGTAVVPGMGGAGGSAGEWGVGSRGASSTTDAGVLARCDIPPMPTTDDPRLVDAQAAIRRYCHTLVEDPCLVPDFNAYLSDLYFRFECPALGDLVAVCEIDAYLGYIQMPAECDPQWLTAMQCLTDADWSTMAVACGSVPMHGPFQVPRSFPCSRPSGLLNDCLWYAETDVTGDWSTCDYGQREDNPGYCWVSCLDPDAWKHSRSFGAECRGPENGPFECACKWNDHALSDYFVEGDGGFVASSCEAAASRLADGYCHALSSCCFSWTDSVTGESRCECTRDPALGGFTSCDAVAESLGGTLVDRCEPDLF